MDVTYTYSEIALHVPIVWLPRDGIPYHRFAVVACDQYTWQPEYWEEVDRFVGDSPSALRLIFPEVYLDADDRAERISGIRNTMREYLEQGILCPREPGFVVVERRTPLTPSRHGLIVALDLEQYDYRTGASSLIRASEGTLVDRLPARIEIRQEAPLEVPHIMVLIDDPDGTVIEPLLQEDLPVLYDFDLMQGGGHVRGRHVAQPGLIRQVADALQRLLESQVDATSSARAPLLYAIGDGNHSLAAAKEVWERLKASGSDPARLAGHPARHALVELVNVHDDGLRFEPIHRIVLDVDVQDLLASMEAYYRDLHIPFQHHALSCPEESGELADDSSQILFLAEGTCRTLDMEDPRHHLKVASVQAFLDAYLESHPKVRLDYIHGDDTLLELAASPRSAGLVFPAVTKHDLFRTIMLDGAFPRKTFSMGQADEKRFYIEARRILP